MREEPAWGKIKMQDILTITGIDAVAASIIWATDPSFLKWIFGLGFATLCGLLFVTKGSGRVAIYGSNLLMAFLTVAHYF